MLSRVLVDGVVVASSGLAADGATDDTAAVADAIARGQVVPPGHYLITRSIEVPSGAVLGSGPGTVFTAADVDFDVFVATGDEVEFRNFKIVGAATDASTTQFGIFTDTGGPDFVTVDGVVFEGLNNGVKNNDGTGWSVSHIRADLVGTISGTGYAVLFGAASNGMIEHVVALAGRHAVYLAAGTTQTTVRTVRGYGLAEATVSVYSMAHQPFCDRIDIDDVITYGGGSDTPDSGSVQLNGKVRNSTVRNSTSYDFDGEGFVFNGFAYDVVDDVSVNAFNRAVNCDAWRSGRRGLRAVSTHRATFQGCNAYDSGRLGSSPGIEVSSTGTGGAQVATETRILGGSSLGSGQRCAVQINPTAPKATGTEIRGVTTQAGTHGNILLHGAAAAAANNSAAATP